MGEQFTSTRIPGLFYRAENLRCYAGHIKLFGRHFHSWGNEVGGRDNDWADHRVWTIGFVALHHVTPGKKSTNRAGWSLTFARLKIARIYGGFSVSWRWADRYRTPGR